MAEVAHLFKFKGVRIVWTNFEGVVGGNGKGKYNKMIGVDENGNPYGYRTFNIVLTEDQADELRSYGAKISAHPPKNDDQKILYTITAFIGKYPPDNMFRVIPSGKERLTFKTIGLLDHENIEKADVDINLKYWEKDGNSGYKAWVKNFAVYIKEDEFVASLSNIPDIGGGYSEDYGGPTEDDDEEIPF